MISIISGNKVIGRIISNHSLTLEEMLEYIGYGVSGEGARKAYEDGVEAAYIDDDGVPVVDLDMVRAIFLSQSNIEDAKILAEKINSHNDWYIDECEELCRLADLSDEWDKSTGEDFEDVV